ncbi:hypothetical protein ACVOMV_31910 [Mesorhizobium atlanticum]
MIDALDEARSRIVRFDDGDILAIESYAFDAEKIGTAELFKLPMRASPSSSTTCSSSGCARLGCAMSRSSRYGHRQRRIDTSPGD